MFSTLSSLKLTFLSFDVRPSFLRSSYSLTKQITQISVSSLCSSLASRFCLEKAWLVVSHIQKPHHYICFYSCDVLALKSLFPATDHASFLENWWRDIYHLRRKCSVYSQEHNLSSWTICPCQYFQCWSKLDMTGYWAQFTLSTPLAHVSLNARYIL